MPVSHRYKLAFCHIPRTGGVSICLALELEVKDKHEPASYYRKHFPDYHLFATFRDYDERVISAKAKPPKELPDSKMSLFSKSNEHYLDCEIDTLLRFDDLENDLNKMLIKLGHDVVRLPHVDYLHNKPKQISK